MEIITINTPISGQCYDPAEEQAFSPTLKFVRRIYTIDRVGIILFGMTKDLMTIILYSFSLQNATSFLVKASTPIDLPAFSNADISCVYQILVSASRPSFPAPFMLTTIILSIFDLISTG